MLKCVKKIDVINNNKKINVVNTLFFDSLNMYICCYRGYTTHHTVEDLESCTTYRFRLRISRANGDCCLTPAISATTSSKSALSVTTLFPDLFQMESVWNGRIKHDETQFICFRGANEWQRPTPSCKQEWWWRAEQSVAVWVSEQHYLNPVAFYEN